VYAVRREDAKDWLCPWITRDWKGCQSWPVEWPFDEAKAKVDKYRTSSSLFAVYSIQGKSQKKVYPPTERI